MGTSKDSEQDEWRMRAYYREEEEKNETERHRREEQARNIKLYREKKGFTQQQLADALGVRQQTIALYESGRKNPKFATLKKFAEALSVPVEDLLPIGVYLVAPELETANASIGIDNLLRGLFNLMEKNFTWERADALKQLTECFLSLDEQGAKNVIRYAQYEDWLMKHDRPHDEKHYIANYSIEDEEELFTEDLNDLDV